MEETIDGANKQKLKFDDSEYFLDDLPKEAKQLVMGLEQQMLKQRCMRYS